MKLTRKKVEKWRQRAIDPHILVPRQTFHAICDALLRADEALTEIGGLDCDCASPRTGKPCGACFSCWARAATLPADSEGGE